MVYTRSPADSRLINKKNYLQNIRYKYEKEKT